VHTTSTFNTNSQIKKHRRTSSVNFRGARHFCPKNVYEKLTKCPNFTWFLSEKVSKYPNFYDICSKNLQNSGTLHTFCPKNARILYNNCPKIFFPNLEGARAPAAPVSYAYIKKSSCQCFDAVAREAGGNMAQNNTCSSYPQQFCIWGPILSCIIS